MALVLLVLRMECAWLYWVFSPLSLSLLLSRLFECCFLVSSFFGFLFYAKSSPALPALPFISLAHLSLIQICVQCPSVPVLTGCLSPFSLGHLWPFCSCSPGCCFSLHLALESCNSSSFTPSLHRSFHRAASIIFASLDGDFVLKVKVKVVILVT